MPPLRVLIPDPVKPESLRMFAEWGIEADLKTDLDAAALREAIGGYDGLVVRSRTQVTADLVSAAHRLRVIGRAGTGTDNIDVDAASRRGIIVMNTPGENSISTAEHAFSLLLALARNVPAADRSMREGRKEPSKFVGVQLHGKTLGVLGLGRIGREVASRAAAFGMKVLGYDPYLPAETAGRFAVELVTLPRLLEAADFVTLHVPLTEETRHVIGDAEIALMKPGARIVNCARGGLVDERALLAALDSGRVAGAALDVLEAEDLAKNPLVRHPKVVVTPHLGASTVEAQEQVTKAIVRQVADALRGGPVRNAVNMVAIEPDLLPKIGPYLRLAEKLGRFLGQILTGAAKEITIAYHGAVIEFPARPLTTAFLKGFFRTILSEPVNEVNAFHTARERGVSLNEVRRVEHQEFSTLVSASVVTDKERRSIAGTLIGKGDPRIVRIDDLPVEAAPEGSLLVLGNVDRPGMVGLLGTLLGERQVNIAAMTLGRDKWGGEAIAILNLDSPVPADVLDAIRAKDGIAWARSVDLR